MFDALVSIGRVAAAGSGLLLDGIRPARSGGLPRGPADLSPGWLGHALEPLSPGVRVARFTFLERHSGTTTRARIALDYADLGADPNLPERFFVKFAPHGLLQQVFVICTGIGRNELAFYRQLRPGLPLRAPDVYAVASGAGDRRFVILLEDIASHETRLPRVGHPTTLAEAQSVVTELARLHAVFWQSPRFRADLAWIPSRENRRRDMSWERFVTGQMLRIAVKRFAGELPPEFAQVADLVVRQRDGLEALWAEGDRTLVHGDCHIGNLFFERDAVGFLDWQLIGHAPGMRDVSYFLCSSLPTPLRQREERELIALYLSVLADARVRPPDFDSAWQQHRLFAVYAWLAAAFTAAAGEGLQPYEVAMAGMRRTTDAVIDLESVPFARTRLRV